MSIHSQLPYDQSTSRARVPAGGIHLIASIDFVSEAQFTASFFGSTKALHGENAIPSAETTTHNHSNQQYSITAVTTSAGAIAERYAYSAYGEPTIFDGSGSTLSSSAINNRYLYTGREWDATVGLYHFRARWMSPKSGRFLSRDPIGFGGSRYGLYAFVSGRIFGNLDPSGEKDVSSHGAPCTFYKGCDARLVSGFVGDIFSDVNDFDFSQFVFEGNCGCLADRNSAFKLDRDNFPKLVAAAECKTQDAYEFLDKKKPGSVTICGCGLTCKSSGNRIGSFAVVDYQEVTKDYSFTVYVSGTVDGMKCLVRSTPMKPNQEACKVTIPAKKPGNTTWFLMTFYYGDGTCEYVGK